MINAGKIEVHAPAGELLGAQEVAGDYCDLAWSGNELIVGTRHVRHQRGAPPADSATLDGGQTKLLDGGEPRWPGSAVRRRWPTQR